MRITFSINNRTLAVLSVFFVVLAGMAFVFAQGTGTQSHPWSQIVCTGCISSGNIASGAVTASAIQNGAVISVKVADNAITGTKIADGSITDADISSTAAISGTKISPNFGSQNMQTAGSMTAGSFCLGGSCLTSWPSVGTKIIFPYSSTQRTGSTSVGTPTKNMYLEVWVNTEYIDFTCIWSGPPNNLCQSPSPYYLPANCGTFGSSFVDMQIVGVQNVRLSGSNACESYSGTSGAECENPGGYRWRSITHTYCKGWATS